jgi:hypothetical protein
MQKRRLQNRASQRAARARNQNLRERLAVKLQESLRQNEILRGTVVSALRKVNQLQTELQELLEMDPITFTDCPTSSSRLNHVGGKSADSGPYGSR